MIYVIDASFAAAHSLPDEQNDTVDSFFDGITGNDEIFVPQLFWYEISNIFRSNVRRRRITVDQATECLKEIGCLVLTTDTVSGSAYSDKIFRLAQEYELSSYDASYLELALRKGAALATLDDDLNTAAGKVTLARV
jgi:predicted nucleic acid-binding protein